MKPLRIGLAGFGRLARDYYLPAFRALPEARLVAVADPLPQSRDEAARRVPSAELYSDTSEMLDRAALDGLLVASLPSTHLAIWNDAARRGLPVFMEKPFVLSGQLDAIVRPEGGARLMIDFNRRFWPPYRRAAELVSEGALGAPAQLEYRLHVDVISWSTVTRHRLSTGEGGILHDLGGHAIDLASDLLGGEPETVRASTESARRPDDLSEARRLDVSEARRLDRLRLDLAFPGGSTAFCDLAYAERTSERLTIRGPKGTLRLPDPNMALHVARNGRSGSALPARSRDLATFAYRAIRRDRSMARFSIRSALDAFVRALGSGAAFVPGFEDAVRNVRWLEAAERSAREGRVVGRPA